MPRDGVATRAAKLGFPAHAEWHPRCTSLRAEYGHGERVELNLEARGRGEAITATLGGVPILLRPPDSLEGLGIGWCDYSDLSLSFLDPTDDWPQEWRCPECGGTTFEGVHADDQAAGLKEAPDR